jgi:hypothetical protein
MSWISDLLTWLGLIKPGGNVTPGVHGLTTWVPLRFSREGKASKVFPFSDSVKPSSSDLAEFTAHLSKGPAGALAACSLVPTDFGGRTVADSRISLEVGAAHPGRRV